MKAPDIILPLLFATLTYSEECRPLECPVCMNYCINTTCITSGDCLNCMATQNCLEVFCKEQVGCFEECPPGSLGIMFNNNSSTYNYCIVRPNCYNVVLIK